MRPVPGSGSRAEDPLATAGIRRFEIRTLLGWTTVVVGAVPFLLLWLLVRAAWTPLAALDRAVAADLNTVVSTSPLAVGALGAVTELGGTGTAILLFGLATLFLLMRRQRRLAAFVVATGIGLAVLGPVTKAIVNRARPVVASPVAETPSNASFPSGHAMTALVTLGVLLLLVLPGVRRQARRWLIAGTALLVVAVGVTRLALGVHFVSDVLAGWALGAGWLAVTVAAFRVWQHDWGVNPDEPLDPLDVEPAQTPELTPDSAPVLPRGRATVVRILAAATALFVGISTLGLLVTDALGDTWLGRFDREVADWFVGTRNDRLTAVMEATSSLSGTRTFIAVGLSLAVLALGASGSWRPVVFVVVTLVGEVLLYLLSSLVVSRPRPDVPDLTTGLPTAASWPSGHVAAAVALYGAVAAVIVTQFCNRWRWAILTLPLLLAPAIGISRIYVAAHYPTDVMAGLVLGGVWVTTCAYLLLGRSGQNTRVGPPTTEPIEAAPVTRP